LIEKTMYTNNDMKYKANDIKGMTIYKEIIPTKAKVQKEEIKKFLIVGPNEFVYNPRTHGKRIGLGFNNTNGSFIISWNNIAFRVKKECNDIIDPTFLFMYLKRDEWDREACYNSWGSSTEVFSWETFCDMKIPLPDIKIQEKYVAIYKAILNNFESFESQLKDLKLICDGYIEDLKIKHEMVKIGPYISRTDERNSDNKIKNVMGVSVYKKFREPTSKVDKKELRNYKIVHNREISFVQTTHNEKVFAFALNDTDTDIVVSSVNEVFKSNEYSLITEFLALWFSRKEFDRYARFHSWGSARETFTWSDLINVKIPLCPVELQKDIVQIYNAYITRRKLVEKLENMRKNICPILIAGSIKEATAFDE